MSVLAVEDDGLLRAEGSQGVDAGGAGGGDCAGREGDQDDTGDCDEEAGCVVGCDSVEG